MTTTTTVKRKREKTISVSLLSQMADEQRQKACRRDLNENLANTHILKHTNIQTSRSVILGEKLCMCDVKTEKCAQLRDEQNRFARL